MVRPDLVGRIPWDPWSTLARYLWPVPRAERLALGALRSESLYSVSGNASLVNQSSASSSLVMTSDIGRLGPYAFTWSISVPIEIVNRITSTSRSSLVFSGTVTSLLQSTGTDPTQGATLRSRGCHCSGRWLPVQSPDFCRLALCVQSYDWCIIDEGVGDSHRVTSISFNSNLKRFQTVGNCASAMARIVA
jgi:hypothetical protein